MRESDKQPFGWFYLCSNLAIDILHYNPLEVFCQDKNQYPYMLFTITEAACSINTN